MSKKMKCNITAAAEAAAAAFVWNTQILLFACQEEKKLYNLRLRRLDKLIVLIGEKKQQDNLF